MREMTNSYIILVGIPEGKRPLRRARRRLKCNIRIELREIVLKVVDWIHLAQTGIRGGLL
jgi:hypothetical protein